jgi:hypothetical protein
MYVIIGCDGDYREEKEKERGKKFHNARENISKNRECEDKVYASIMSNYRPKNFIDDEKRLNLINSSTVGAKIHLHLNHE